MQHDATALDTESWSRVLACPIILDEPDRLVYPASWLEHVPFAFWMVDALRPSVFVEPGTHSGNRYAAFAQAIHGYHTFEANLSGLRALATEDERPRRSNSPVHYVHIGQLNGGRCSRRPAAVTQT